ncbi:hypothetical protein SISSUDRAFT_928324 [Sistotremastrum suecicum HHB10207 ss-3]|uniref:RING-type domain-containing protein n=1 Tax=Sistotremastrum suecicum HHB10207 ss-3 TaxID=1314776 RepID=A0A166BRY9_9AGAM|nr:hypothetical protein SISSUDRAFT_928324 [Sistotremastrum suecicum HHB10207 ss-3]
MVSTPRRSTRRKAEEEIEQVLQSPSEDEQDDTNPRIEDHLRTALTGVRKIQRNLKALEKENATLKERIKTLSESTPKRQRKVADDSVKISELSAEVERLKEANLSQKKKISQLKRAEAKRELKDLTVDWERVQDVDSLATQMRDILTKLNDIVTTPTLGEGEDCPICLEGLVVGETVSLPCEHPLGTDCYRKLLKPGVTCPHCRTPFNPDDVEPITMTAIDQWDAILELMQQWSQINSGAEPEGVVELEDVDDNPFVVPDHQESEEEEQSAGAEETEENRDVQGSGWTEAELIEASNMPVELSDEDKPEPQSRQTMTPPETPTGPVVSDDEEDVVTPRRYLKRRRFRRDRTFSNEDDSDYYVRKRRRSYIKPKPDELDDDDTPINSPTFDTPTREATRQRLERLAASRRQRR